MLEGGIRDVLKDKKVLTKKQKEFADEYLETGNGTKAALKAYDTKKEDTAAVIGSQNLRKLKVQEYLEQKSERAAEVIFELLENANNETVKLNAGKDILDRAGHKPTDKSEIEHKGDIIIKQIIYGITDPSQIQPKTIPDTFSESNPEPEV